MARAKSRVDLVHLPENDPRYHMPYTPAIKVHGGAFVFVAGVTAAPVYHSHPHVPEEFAGIPTDAVAQTEQALENLRRVLDAAGADLGDVVQIFRFIKDLDRNQDAVNAVTARAFGGHRPASTTVEVNRLATDARLVVELAAVAVTPNGGRGRTGRRRLRRNRGRPARRH
jgi:enamine deaminase RidA (YjgF/YER057c/UK114 family)